MDSTLTDELPHTYGPWETDSHHNIIASDPNGIHSDIYVAQILKTSERGRVACRKRQASNARLIASAPCLLCALVSLYDIMREHEDILTKPYMTHALEQARDVITHVIGHQP